MSAEFLHLPDYAIQDLITTQALAFVPVSSVSQLRFLSERVAPWSQDYARRMVGIVDFLEQNSLTRLVDGEQDPAKRAAVLDYLYTQYFAYGGDLGEWKNIFTRKHQLSALKIQNTWAKDVLNKSNRPVDKYIRVLSCLRPGAGCTIDQMLDIITPDAEAIESDIPGMPRILALYEPSNISEELTALASHTLLVEGDGRFGYRLARGIRTIFDDVSFREIGGKIIETRVNVVGAVVGPDQLYSKHRQFFSLPRDPNGGYTKPQIGTGVFASIE